MDKERMELIAKIRIDIIKGRIRDKDYLQKDRAVKFAMYAKDMETLNLLNAFELVSDEEKEMLEKDILEIIYNKEGK